LAADLVISRSVLGTILLPKVGLLSASRSLDSRGQKGGPAGQQEKSVVRPLLSHREWSKARGQVQGFGKIWARRFRAAVDSPAKQGGPLSIATRPRTQLYTWPGVDLVEESLGSFSERTKKTANFDEKEEHRYLIQNYSRSETL